MQSKGFVLRLRPALGMIVCLTVCLASAGCGSSSGGQKLVPVAGKVTYKGQPLKQGRVTFMPLSPGNSSSGPIIDGQYRLGTYKEGDGAPPGKYQVAVTSWVKEPDMQSPGEPAIPPKYFSASSSQLTAEVGSQSDINFDLKD